MVQKRFYKTFKRKEKTDYGKRLNMLKSGKTRLIVRITSKNILAQLVKFSVKGDVVAFAASTKSLEKKGWKCSRTNLSAAYLLGYLLAKKASGKVTEAILDIGKRGSVAGSKIYAVVKGVIDGGVKIPLGEDVLPSDDRIKGMHIKAYAELLAKENKEKYSKVFSAYLKNNIKPELVPTYFEKMKATIEGVK